LRRWYFLCVSDAITHDLLSPFPGRPFCTSEKSRIQRRSVTAYQAESSETWYDRLNVWIKELDDPTHTGWSTKDLMHIDSSDTQLGLTVLRSLHSREKGLSEIEIRHLWIEMECYLGA
ncbi:MAG: hypothetical protein ACYCY0_13500, partial [Acidithiobacillus ferrivorans]